MFYFPGLIFWILVCMAIGTKMIMRLIYKFEENLALVQALMKLSLHLCRAKVSSLVDAVFVRFIHLA